MNLLTDELRHSIPALYSQPHTKLEDKLVHIRYFFPLGSWTWYVLEGSEENNEFVFFGFVTGIENEWGYFTLKQLEEVEVSGYKVERDLNFEPKSFRELQLN